MIEEKNGAVKKHQKRDYIVFFIVAFVLIFLTSSFVIENVYSSADKLKVTPEGVKEMYLSAIGARDFEDLVLNQQAEQKKEKKTETSATADQSTQPTKTQGAEEQ